MHYWARYMGILHQDSGLIVFRGIYPYNPIRHNGWFVTDFAHLNEFDFIELFHQLGCLIQREGHRLERRKSKPFHLIVEYEHEISFAFWYVDAVFNIQVKTLNEGENLFGDVTLHLKFCIKITIFSNLDSKEMVIGAILNSDGKGRFCTNLMKPFFGGEVSFQRFPHGAVHEIMLSKNRLRLGQF